MTRYESCVGAAMILTLKRPPSDQEIAYLIRQLLYTQLLLMPILGEFYKFGDYFHQLANLPVIDVALVFLSAAAGLNSIVISLAQNISCLGESKKNYFWQEIFDALWCTRAQFGPRLTRRLPQPRGYENVSKISGVIGIYSAKIPF